MGKRIGRVYKHSQHKYPYPSPNTTFVLPPHYVSSLQNDRTSVCGATMISLNEPPPLSNLTTTNQADTDVKNDIDSQYFATPIKRNHRTTEIRYTNTKTTRVRLKFQFPRLYQQIPSTPTTSLKLNLSEKQYFCFQIYITPYDASQCST